MDDTSYEILIYLIYSVKPIELIKNGDKLLKIDKQHLADDISSPRAAAIRVLKSW